MGTLGGGNGGGRPPDNGGQPEGLPGLPPEWGTVVIPDDPAELAAEAAGVRRELRRHTRRNRWRRWFGRPPRPESEGQPSLGPALMIMAIAVLATLTSLFAVAWPGTSRRAAVPDSTAGAGRYLPDVTLVDAAGSPVRVREMAPAAILLVEDCDCADLIAATAQVTPPGVAVLAVGRTAPRLPAVAAGGGTIRALADPNGILRGGLRLGPPPTGAASVVLVSRDGQIRHTLPATRALDGFRGQLANL